MSLADKVIQANTEADNPSGPELDDIGFPLPKPQTRRAHCEYLTARLWYLNPRIYFHEGHLWINEDIIPETKDSYYKLAKFPNKIRDYENQYVWRRLRELAPVLDTDTIAVLPNLTFNMRTGKLKHERAWTTTPWKEEE